MTSPAVHFYDSFLALGERRGMRERRRALLSSTRGRVLEIGAGTGLNLAHYPDAVTELVLTEPDDGMRSRLDRRAGYRTLDAPAERLPFEDGSFDFVVSTMVLCTVEDPAAALAEIRRVLAPEGRLLFVEHVRSDSPRLARWQDRLEAPWRAFAVGCRCNRPTLGLLAASGLEVERLERARWRGMPFVVSPLAWGAARA
jgi:ubiquinone/menaquinone biosynthesis C-methylase UbiE